jgi:hypothetical protein
MPFFENERNEFLTEKDRTFQLVRDGFSFGVSHKIGIAVYRNFIINAESSTGMPDMTVTEIEKVYGEINKINIYAGEITCICDGGLCFEHNNITTFEGCSGAIVFLLEYTRILRAVLLKKTMQRLLLSMWEGGMTFVGDGLVRNFAFKIQVV